MNLRNSFTETIFRTSHQCCSPVENFLKKISKRGKELLILVREQKVRVDVHCIAVMILSVSSVPALCFLTTPQA